MYTQYYELIKPIDDESWKKICIDTKKVIKYYKKLNINVEANHPSGIMVSNKKKYINFNGIGDDSYETFSFGKEQMRFNFCKTNQNEYDKVVCSVMLVIYHHAKDCVSMSSDGNFNDWKEMMKNNAKIFGYAFELPPVINTEESNLFARQLAVEIYEKEIKKELYQEEKNQNKTNKLKI